MFARRLFALIFELIFELKFELKFELMPPLRAFLCALLCCWSACAVAAPARTLRFEQLSVEHGLAQESVLAMAQDKQGFMWFGSQAGLSRYDGYRVTVFKNSASEPRSLADNWVSALHVDGDGRLWVGTDGGLDLYDPASRSFTHYVPREPGKRGNGNRHVRAIVGDGRRGLWLASGDGLQHFDPASGRFTIWHHAAGDDASLGDDQINALARDGAGRLWIGTATGLDMLAAGANRFQHFRLAPAAASKFNVVQSLLADNERTLWIGTLAGVERWRLGALERGEAPQRVRLGAAEGLRDGAVNSIYQDADASLWLGGYSGLYRWLPASGRFVHYRHLAGDRHSVADNEISSLYRDRAGTFWVGTWYGGASRVDLGSGGFERLARQPDSGDAPPDNKVHAIAEDGRGRLWLGTQSGLSQFDAASGALRPQRPLRGVAGAPGDDQVSALWHGRGDILWLGGKTGLTRFDTDSGAARMLSLAHGDPNADIIRGIGGDRAGMLWIASRGGLHRFDPVSETFQTYRHDPADSASLADNMVRPVLEDRSGALWVGTFNGLDLLDRASGRFRHFRHDPKDPHSLSHDEVHTLFEDKRGALWVGTANGLNRMETGADGTPRFRRYLRKDGLADDAIAAILGNDANWLWLSTNSGISLLNTETGVFRNYDGSDGTIEGAYLDGSALRGGDGTLYFGGFNGVTAFAPQAIRSNAVAPPVAITGFQIFNKPVEPGQGDYPDVLDSAIDRSGALTLNADASVFSLEFAALHYAAPQRNRYAYQLQGFDRDWVYTDAGKRFATYTNLDPGRYLFRVKAANKDGLWNDNGATLAITILPPLWKTWWFRGLLLMLLLGGSFALFHARMRGMQRQKHRLEQQVGLRTAEVEQKNRLLQRQEKQVRRQSEELALANRALQENDERLRLAKQKAEDATRQKSEFLANMSHEMRTPLAGVISMLDFALRDLRLPDATREQIVRGQTNARALLEIINDLLDFSKIEAGKLSIEKIDFALAGALDSVAGLFEQQAAARGLGFSINFGHDLPQFVLGDPGRLRQVLVNLVGNAFKFTERGAVRVGIERAGSGPGVNLIRFSVRDSGIGIESEAIPRLFQKFEQADSSTTRRYGGTGLGLTISLQLVELMGGQIAVSSRPGIGSTFSFVLPLADGHMPTPRLERPQLRHSHRLRVLCAEDFETNQIIIRTMLEERGHYVDIAADGVLALAACARERYDLVLMDGRMPHMDGASAARLIRAGGPPKAPVRDPDVMIIALTANAGEDDRKRYIAAGMNAFLSKPIDEGQLHEQLARAIERQLRRGVELEPQAAAESDAIEADAFDLDALEADAAASGAAAPSAGELDAMFGVSAAADEAAAATALRRRIRSVFAADAGPRLARIEQALAARDGETAGLLLHGIKGSAAYLEQAELYQLCDQLERAADQGDWLPLDAALPRLRALLGACAAEAGV